MTEEMVLMMFAAKCGQDPFTYVDKLTPGQRAVALVFMRAWMEME